MSTKREYQVLGVPDDRTLFWTMPIQAEDAYTALLKWQERPTAVNQPIRIVKVVTTGELIEFRLTNGRYVQQGTT